MHNRSFIDEANVTLQKVGALEWHDVPQFVDGKVHQLGGGDNRATYLYRTIQSGLARPLEVSIGSDDSFKLWLNGKLVADMQVSRGWRPTRTESVSIFSPVRIPCCLR